MANMQMNKTPMPEQDPQVRNHNFLEVAQGYTLEQAMNEAQRCIHCKNPACVSGCPVGIPIPDFLAKVAEGDIAAAYEILSNANALPAISGRVCPQEEPVRGQVRPGREGRARGHRPGGALRGRLGRRAGDRQRGHRPQERP